MTRNRDKFTPEQMTRHFGESFARATNTEKSEAVENGQAVAEQPEGLDDGTHVVQATAERKPLEWHDADGEWEAKNADGLIQPDGTPSAWYVVPPEEDGGRWDADCSEFPTVAREPDGFATMQAAQAWCEARDAELWAKAHPLAITVAPEPGGRVPTARSALSPATEESAKRLEWLEKKRADEQKVDDKIRKKDEEIYRKGAEIKTAQGELKALETEREKLVQKLRDLVRGTDQDLFTLEPAPTDASVAAPVASTECDKPPIPDESWKLVTIEELGIKGRALKALHEHVPPLTTHGELSAWQEKKGDFWAKDIAGLGPKGREEIENAQFAYFNAHPELDRAPKREEGEPFFSAKVLERSEWALRVDGDGYSAIIRADLYSDSRWGFYASAAIGDARNEFDNVGFAEKAAAITAAAKSIQAWLMAIPAKAKRGEKANYVKEIFAELDKLDRALVGQAGSADEGKKAAVAEAVSA